jgi:hypothetical protein
MRLSPGVLLALRGRFCDKVLNRLLLDLGFSRRGEALITRSLVVIGVATAGYGFWLIAAIASKG